MGDGPRAAAGAAASEERVFLVRLGGELSIKSQRTRKRLTRRLADNLRDALSSAGLEHSLDVGWARILVRSPSPEAAEVVSRVFGVSSVSEAVRVSWRTLDDLVAIGERLFAAEVAGKRFAVRVRRGGDPRHIPFRSADLERALGARLLPHAAGVDLGNPEVTARIEVRAGGTAYCMTGRVVGPDGLPIAGEGRALALVSGGFDSVVAAWQLLRRGVTLDYVFCNLGGEAHRDGVLEVMKVLADRWSYGYRPRINVLEFGPVVDELRARTPETLWQVILKRQMLRAADRLARIGGAMALVTGEAVGQVSSQTLANLSVISDVSPFLQLRPLIGHNKDEITRLARQIGTYDASAKIPEYCGLAGKQPATSAKPAKVAAAEAALDPETLERALGERVVLDLRSLDLARMKAPELEVDSIPPEATVVDLRSAAAFDAWHWPGARHLEYAAALRAHREMDAAQRYVFVCEIGLKSAHLAELLHERGVAAHHVKAGMKTLRRLAEAEDPALRALMSPVLLD